MAAAGNDRGKAQLLASYIEKVEKSTGDLISTDHAATLIRLAGAL